MGIYSSGRMKKYRQGDGKEKLPPNKPGEYRIRNGNGAVVYVGETCDINRRMNEHRRSGKFGKDESFEYQVADGRSTSSTRREHERKKIEQHNPERNKRAGGGGRRKEKVLT